MNAEKKMQEWTEAERPLTDFEDRFMELFHQLSYKQKCAVAFSVILSAAANGAGEVRV